MRACLKYDFPKEVLCFARSIFVPSGTPAIYDGFVLNAGGTNFANIYYIIKILNITGRKTVSNAGFSVRVNVGKS